MTVCIAAVLRPLAVAGISLVFLLPTILTSWAIENCAEYAARALNQVQMGQGCVQGPRWSPNLVDHLNWCRGQSAQLMTSEDAARRTELARGCRSNPARITARSCEDYAWRAMSQIELAQQMSNTFPACRFTGPRWSLNVKGHIDWCRTGSPGQRDHEDLERRRAIAQCGPAAAPAPATTQRPPPTTTQLPPPAATPAPTTTPRPPPVATPAPTTTPRPPPATTQLPPPVTTPVPAPAPAPPPAAGLTVEQQAMLSAHNANRAKHCLAALTWSPQAATAAQQWASRCTRDGAAFAHDAGRGSYGENLAWGTNMSAAQAVSLWYNEIGSYNFAAPVWTRSPQVGHFTQMVWRTTTQVGCDVWQCGGEKLWVCRYSPSGNMNVEARPPGFTIEQARQSLVQNVPQVCR